MSEPLRALILEDRPADAELMAAELRRQGFTPEWTRAETEEEFRAALGADLDVILSDFSLPGYDAVEALQEVRRHGLDVPVIVVTGSIGEETAAACIRAGAADYLLKDRLSRLGLAVREAIRRRRLEADRLRVESALLQSQSELATVFESSPVPMLITDGDLRVVRLNQEAAAIIGTPPTEAFGRPMCDVLGCSNRTSDQAGDPGGSCEGCSLSSLIRSTVESGEAHRGVERMLQLRPVAGGAPTTWLVSTSPLGAADARLAVVALNDITTQKATEDRVRQLNRLLETIRGINRLIAHEPKPEWLLAETCRIAVEVGGFAMAWVGEADLETGVIVPRAAAGAEEGYLSVAAVRCDGSPLGAGPAGTAVRERHPVVVEDIATDPSMGPWREAALARGYRSKASLPLLVEDRVFGVLSVFAERPAMFDGEVMALLVALADDLGFALGAREAAAGRERAEAALRESEERYRQLFEAESDAILLIDNATGRILEANSAATALYGYAHDELLRLRNADLSAEPEATRAVTHETPVDRDRVVTVRDRLHRRKDGSVVPVEITGRFFEREGRAVHIAAIRDVSERRRAEEELRRDLELRTALAEISQAALGWEISIPAVAGLVLEHARRLTTSEHGFVSEVDPVTGDAVQHTLTEMLTEALCPLRDDNQRIVSPRDADGAYAGLWGHALNTREPFFTNSPATHASSQGAPAGHVPVARFLAVPVVQGGELLGLIALANPTRDYQESDVEVVSRLADYYAVAIRRAREQTALEESEERYRQLFEGSPVGIYRTTRDGRILAANPALVRLLGHGSLEDLQERNLNLEGFELPGDRAEFVREVESSESVSGRETTFTRRDGQLVHVRESARAVRSTEGSVLYYEGVVEDITQQRKMQAERELIFELAVDLFCIADFDGYFRQLNPAWVETLGWSLEELEERMFLELVHPDDRQATAEALAVQLEGRKVLGFENRYRCKDGSYRWLSWNSCPLPEENLVFAVARDVTQAKHLEEQLLQAQKMEAVGRLAGGIAHDFNNLLQALLSHTQLIRLHAADSERVETVADELEQQLLRGAALTRQLLLFSRREVIQRKEIDLNEVIEAQARVLLRRLLRENIELELSLGTGPLPVSADPGQLEQVIMNLVVNASDVLEDGGRVVIRSGRGADETVWLEVEDDGPGIPTSILPKVFEPFFTTKPAGKGTGLGLSVVHGIVTNHGGRVEVGDSESGGARLRVFLPVSAGSGEAPNGEHALSQTVEKGHGERVLVVEDEPATREGLAALLEALGYAPVAVGSAEETAELPDEPAFDVVVTDLVLPGKAGHELAAELRKRWPAAAVVLMSGYTEDEVVKRGVGDGSLHFLQKPFDMKALSEMLQDVLNG